MAPISHLLIYYTTPVGEIVGDSISFRVNLQHEKVSWKRVVAYTDKALNTFVCFLFIMISRPYLNLTQYVVSGKIFNNVLQGSDIPWTKIDPE